MGTLTANVPQLADHCSHKLASSCRLTSTHNCCACADDRPHNPTYRKYIDGVGYVQLGVSFLDRPNTPNQDDFTKRWLEFHQGYRVTQTPDGREKRIAVRGEPLQDVDPGVMPRTLGELRAGRLTGTEVAPVAEMPPALAEVDAGPSLDEALDQLLGEALTEEGQDQAQTTDEIEADTRNMGSEETQPDVEETSPIPAPLMTAAELATLRHDIEQVRRQIEAEERDSDARQAEMVADAEDMAQTQRRIEEYQQEANSLRRRMTRYHRYIVNEHAHAEAVEERMSAREETVAQIGERLRVLRHQLRQYRHRVEGEGNFARVLGTREDIQSEDYISPITNMFMRMDAWGRRRQAQPTTPQESPTQVDGSLGQAEPGETPLDRLPDPHGVRQTQQDDFTERHQNGVQRTAREQLEALREARLAQHQGDLSRLLGRVPPGPAEPSSLDLHLDALTAQAEISTRQTLPGGPNRAAVAFFGTPTNRSGTDPEPSPSANVAGTNAHGALDNWLPADTSPEVDLHGWLSVRGYVPNTRDRRTTDTFTSTASQVLLQQPGALASTLRLAPSSPDRDSSDEDDNPRLSVRRERIRREARQQFQERHQDFQSLLSGGRDGTGSSRDEILEATIAAYTTGRRHRFPTLTRATRGPSTTPQPPRGLDIADERPEAKTDEEMMVKVECKICLSQVADTACLPCGHLCMCSWCADQAVPVKSEDRTRPAKKGIKCPVCRENVKSRARIFV
ncbi:hypothetical protein EG327_011673 [Venturia inaequalis]|uniref:RING-type domain-containing protein n=1 Tax=Venturia inaequalis TaxID=5025 RepID=A0A8H3VRA8_VENIN|nr:hypothetical protein EG327_011673 [Venturia inaequalis]